MPNLSVLDTLRIGANSLSDRAGDLMAPSFRIGVTGLSTSGKTVFLTALIHALLEKGHLPALQVARSGRLVDAKLTQQPHDGIARFALEDHIDSLINERTWPSSTRHISQLRVTLRYEPRSAIARSLGRNTVHLDMVDYPGEWLLDLPLLDQSYAEFSAQALNAARSNHRKRLADRYLDELRLIDASAPLDEATAQKIADHFTRYLRSCREEETALSMLPPGRFLMPGDLEGSPAVTFAPLDAPVDGHPGEDALYGAMERRFESYKRLVVRPFFLNHFSRLDRQIVLVDALSAINAGPEAVADLGDALTTILSCFKTGQNSLISKLFGPKIDRIAFAATKADHLHHSQHERLEAVLQHLVDDARKRALFAGADVKTMAIASVRATREATARSGGEDIGAVAGTPMAGETINGQSFDGNRDVAIFPGDLPQSPSLLTGPNAKHYPLRFVRFRPPHGDNSGGTSSRSLAHIRLDRLLEFMIGDQLG